MGFLTTLLGYISGVGQALPIFKTLLDGAVALIHNAVVALLPSGALEAEIAAGIEAASAEMDRLVQWAEDNVPSVMAWVQQLGIDLAQFESIFTSLSSGGQPQLAGKMLIVKSKAGKQVLVKGLSKEAVAKLFYCAYNHAADQGMDLGVSMAAAHLSWAKKFGAAAQAAKVTH